MPFDPYEDDIYDDAFPGSPRRLIDARTFYASAGAGWQYKDEEIATHIGDMDMEAAENPTHPDELLGWWHSVMHQPPVFGGLPPHFYAKNKYWHDGNYKAHEQPSFRVGGWGDWFAVDASNLPDQNMWYSHLDNRTIFRTDVVPYVDHTLRQDIERPYLENNTFEIVSGNWYFNPWLDLFGAYSRDSEAMLLLRETLPEAGRNIMLWLPLHADVKENSHWPDYRIYLDWKDDANYHYIEMTKIPRDSMGKCWTSGGNTCAPYWFPCISFYKVSNGNLEQLGRYYYTFSNDGISWDAIWKDPWQWIVTFNYLGDGQVHFGTYIEQTWLSNDRGLGYLDFAVGRGMLSFLAGMQHYRWCITTPHGGNRVGVGYGQSAASDDDNVSPYVGDIPGPIGFERFGARQLYLRWEETTKKYLKPPSFQPGLLSIPRTVQESIAPWRVANELFSPMPMADWNSFTQESAVFPTPDWAMASDFGHGRYCRPGTHRTKAQVEFSGVVNPPNSGFGGQGPPHSFTSSWENPCQDCDDWNAAWIVEIKPGNELRLPGSSISPMNGSLWDAWNPNWPCPQMVHNPDVSQPEFSQLNTIYSGLELRLTNASPFVVEGKVYNLPAWNLNLWVHTFNGHSIPEILWPDGDVFPPIDPSKLTEWQLYMAWDWRDLPIDPHYNDSRLNPFYDDPFGGEHPGASLMRLMDCSGIFDYQDRLPTNSVHYFDQIRNRWRFPIWGHNDNSRSEIFQICKWDDASVRITFLPRPDPSFTEEYTLDTYPGVRIENNEITNPLNAPIFDENKSPYDGYRGSEI